MTELTTKDLKEYLREDVDTPVLQMVLDAAKQTVLTYTGQTAEVLDAFPDVSAAVLSIACDLYDNRTAVSQSQYTMSPLISQILGSYSVNLVVSGDDSDE